MTVMDIRGLILVDTDAADNGSFTRTPLVMTDVAGASPLQRTAERLHRFGVDPVTIVVDDAACGDLNSLPRGTTCLPALPGRFWRVAESAFNELSQKAELVLVVRLGAYSEIDFDKLIQFHLEGNRRVTQGIWRSERLAVFCLSASRRNDAASLFRSQLSRCRTECEFFSHTGYMNRMSGPHDLRQLCIDVLTMKTETLPAGREIRPGIWAAPGALIEKGSRILAPAFIGSSARIHCGAVITRCTSIERHARVDCGTVVENSTVLPYVYLGAGLDLAHSVAGTGRIANLRRSVTVDVSDEKLLARVLFSRRRMLLSLASLLPAKIRSGLFGEPAIVRTPADGEGSRLDRLPGASAESSDTASEFPSNLAVARRYGNQ
jgi:hypothetical protein